MPPDAVDTGSKFTAAVVDTGSKLTPGVVDTGGKFATSVVDTGGKFSAGDTGTNLPPVPLIQVVHLVQISPRNFLKFETTLTLFSGA